MRIRNTEELFRCGSVSSSVFVSPSHVVIVNYEEEVKRYPSLCQQDSPSNFFQSRLSHLSAFGSGS